MTMLRGVAVSLAFGICLGTASAAEKKPHAVPPPPAKVVPPARQQAPAGRGQAAGVNSPGERPIDKLLQMTPAEREKALASLPPARRENIERRLGALQKMPTAMQNRLRNRQELLQSLPPQRQNQVRRSMKQFADLPEDRKGQLNQELQRMAPMPDEERRARMNSEEYRNRYSASEQQMMGNLMEIVPQQ